MRAYRRKPVSHQQYSQKLHSNLTRWLRRRSRRLLDEWLEAALVLMDLDLEPARPILESLYSPDPRGQKPYDPVRMLLCSGLRFARKSSFAPHGLAQIYQHWQMG